MFKLNHQFNQIYNLIRGCDPQPGAWTKIDSKIVSIYNCKLEKNENITIRKKFIIENKKISVGLNDKKITIGRIKDLKGQKVDAFQLVKGQNPNTTTRSHESRMTWNRMWSPATTSNLSVGFNRVSSVLAEDETSIGPLIFTAMQLQTIGNPSFPFDRAFNRFHYEGLVRHVRGRHTLTAGAGIVRGQVNGVESFGKSGMWAFWSNFEDEFGNTRDMMTNLRLGTPSLYRKAIGDSHRGFRDWRMLYYIGDKWNVSTKQTVNFGVRYEPSPAPVEVSGRSEIPYDCDCNNYSPNFGFAYQLARGWGVLRGAYGLYYGDIPLATYTRIRWNPPDSSTLSLRAPNILDPLEGVDIGPGGRSNIFQLSPDLLFQ